MKTETIGMCVVALLLGMLLANMFKNVCGCKVVEGAKGAKRGKSVKRAKGAGVGDNVYIGARTTISQTSIDTNGGGGDTFKAGKNNKIQSSKFDYHGHGNDNIDVAKHANLSNLKIDTNSTQAN